MGKKEKEDKKNKGKKSKQEAEPAQADSNDSNNDRSGRRDDDRRQGGARDRNRDRSGNDRDHDRDYDRDHDRDRDQDDDRKDHKQCPAVVGRCRSGSQSQVTPCSNEQFLSSILPLLSALKSKQNFLARIQIQKALYDAIDETDGASSDDQCCAAPVKKKSASSCQAPNKGHPQRRTS